MSKMKDFEVSIDYNASFPYYVKAKTKAEAKKKAWEKHKKDRSVRKWVDFDVEAV